MAEKRIQKDSSHGVRAVSRTTTVLSASSGSGLFPGADLSWGPRGFPVTAPLVITTTSHR